MNYNDVYLVYNGKDLPLASPPPDEEVEDEEQVPVDIEFVEDPEVTALKERCKEMERDINTLINIVTRP